MFGCIEMQYLVGPADLVGQSENLAALDILQYLVGPADLVGQSENLAALDISRGEEAEVVMTHAEEAMTWAQQVAALQVENAALRQSVEDHRDALISVRLAYDDTFTQMRARIADLEAENARLKATVAVAAPSFPLNAIKHSA